LPYKNFLEEKVEAPSPSPYLEHRRKNLGGTKKALP